MYVAAPARVAAHGAHLALVEREAAEALARALTDRTITRVDILSGRYARKPFDGHADLVAELS